MIIDHRLIARLERSNADVDLAVTAAYRAHGAADARAEDFGDGALIAQGRRRFVNRAVGVSLNDVGDDGFDHLEAFFADAGVDPAIEVSSWAAPAMLLRAGERWYRPERFVETFALEPSHSADDAVRSDRTVSDVTVRAVTAESMADWQRIFAAAFGYDSRESLAVASLHTAATFDLAGMTHYLAVSDGRALGCGSLALGPDGIAWFVGAATMPGCRNRGVQSALLRRRLRDAARLGAQICAVTASPESVSARNVVRAGFERVHTRVVMRRRTVAEPLTGNRPPTG